MKPPPFAYARASDLEEALDLLAEAGDDAKLLAGGQSLLPLLALRLARPTHLVDISGLSGLDDVGVTDNGGLIIGSLVTHARLEGDRVLAEPWHALTDGAGLIGHYPIRVRGTAGGSFAHADPAAELPVVATALDAEFVIRSHKGSRRIPVDEFFTGPFTTALEPEEMIVEIEFPPPADGRISVFEEFATHSGDFASASVAVALTRDRDGRARDVRIAIGAVGPTPVRAREAETALDGAIPKPGDVAEIGQLAGDVCAPGSDARSGAEFRQELVQVLVERALRRTGVVA